MTHPSALEMILSQALFFGISALSLFITVLFYKWNDGELRKILICFTLSISWKFGIDGVWWLLWDVKILDGVQPVYVRLIENSPLIFSLFWMAKFMKRK